MQRLSPKAEKQGMEGKKKTNKKWHKAIIHKGTIPWLSHCQSGSAMQDTKKQLLPVSCHSSQGCSPDL